MRGIFMGVDKLNQPIDTNELMSLDDMANGHLDLKSLKEAANGDENTQVVARLGATYPSVAKTMRILLEQGTIDATIFGTKSLMTASALADNAYALVTDDTTSANNGYYQKRSGAWVFLPYNFYSIATAMLTGYSTDRLVITDGVNLNTMTQMGSYLGASSRTYANSPVNGKSFILTVEKTNNRFIKHTVIDSSNNDTYVAYFDSTTSPTIKWSLVNNASYRGSSTNANTATVAGNYIVTKVSTTNLPSDFTPTNGYLVVTTFGDFLLQRLFGGSTDSNLMWTRVVRISTSEFNAWQNISSGGGSTPTTSPYAGKTAVFLGDSITENGDYPARVGARLGFTAINGGFGGTRITEMTSNLAGMCGVDVADAINSGDWSVVRAGANTRYNEVPTDDNRAIVDKLEAVNWLNVDYIVCFWGTNDWSNDVPLGVNADNNRTTIKGATAYVIDKLLSKYPHLKIMFVTPMFRGRIQVGDLKDSNSTPNNNGVYLVELGDAIREQAQRRNIPAYDLYRNCGFNVLNYSTYLRDQTIDGLHPYSTVGHQHLANKIGAAFASNF